MKDIDIYGGTNNKKKKPNKQSLELLYPAKSFALPLPLLSARFLPSVPEICHPLRLPVTYAAHCNTQKLFRDAANLA